MRFFLSLSRIIDPLLLTTKTARSRLQRAEAVIPTGKTVLQIFILNARATVQSPPILAVWQDAPGQDSWRLQR